MLTISELKIGTIFVMEGDPWKVLDTQFVKMAQSTGVLQAKIQNLKTGSVISRSFKQADKFGEAEITRIKVNFVFNHRGKYVFSRIDNPSQRFELSEAQIGDDKFYLIANAEFTLLLFEGEIISFELPPKVDLRVVEAPPAEKGNTAQGGRKPVIVETGLTVQTPFFIKEGDVIRVNTETGEYAERL